MDTNHSRSNGFQLTNNICSHSHSGASPYVSAAVRWMCDDLLAKRRESTEKIQSTSSEDVEVLIFEKRKSIECDLKGIFECMLWHKLRLRTHGHS